MTQALQIGKEGKISHCPKNTANADYVDYLELKFEELSRSEGVYQAFPYIEVKNGYVFFLYSSGTT